MVREKKSHASHTFEAHALTFGTLASVFDAHAVTFDALASMNPLERLAIATWLEERVGDMRVDRSSISEEYGVDLVMILDLLTKSIRLDLRKRTKK
jgi:hypothetical protein